MNIKSTIKVFALFLLIALSACSKGSSDRNQDSETPRILGQNWKDYWYNGTAELNRYTLQQARYGEIREGDAVLIFVTEDFLSDRQVKYEGGPKDMVESVLKLNATKKFWTGIYPYSLMTSVFTPITASKPSFKVSTSAQEWCGHSYSQLNHRAGKYEGVLHSYFMREGDDEFTVDGSLEDEIWNQVRLNPDDLPTGTIKLIPGMQFLRLRHRDIQAETVLASLSPLPDVPHTQYRLEYQDFNRVLEIIFENDFPHKIISWEETSGEGRDGALTTRATLTNTIRSPYWGKNSLADSVLRHELGLY